jgi:GNAT superfamily N-acetyltransferase
MVVAGLIYYSLDDNVDLGEVYAGVAPDHRGRGFGSAMVRDLSERNIRAARTRLVGQSWIPFSQRDDHPYIRFAAKHGFSVANVEIRRVVPLPLADDDLDAWQSEAAPHHTDYRLETYFGDVPVARIPSLCEAMNQLEVDAPTGDIELEARKLDTEIFLRREDRAKAAGKLMLLTVAIDRHDTVSAFSTMAIPTQAPEIVYQYGTLVLREHRGHRLGTAVKVANHRRLQQEVSDRSYVETINSEQNGPMVRINEKFGFRPVEILADFQRIIDQ